MTPRTQKQTNAKHPPHAKASHHQGKAFAADDVPPVGHQHSVGRTAAAPSQDREQHDDNRQCLLSHSTSRMSMDTCSEHGELHQESQMTAWEDDHQPCKHQKPESIDSKKRRALETWENGQLVENKTPNEAPKRPLLASALFAKEHRDALKQARPDLSKHDVEIILKKAWQDAPDEAKVKYVAEEARLRLNFRQAMASRQSVKKTKRKRQQQTQRPSEQQQELHVPDDVLDKSDIEPRSTVNTSTEYRELSISSHCFPDFAMSRPDPAISQSPTIESVDPYIGTVGYHQKYVGAHVHNPYRDTVSVRRDPDVVGSCIFPQSFSAQGLQPGHAFLLPQHNVIGPLNQAWTHSVRNPYRGATGSSSFLNAETSPYQSLFQTSVASPIFPSRNDFVLNQTPFFLQSMPGQFYNGYGMVHAVPVPGNVSAGPFVNGDSPAPPYVADETTSAMNIHGNEEDEILPVENPVTVVVRLVAKAFAVFVQNAIAFFMFSCLLLIEKLSPATPEVETRDNNEITTRQRRKHQSKEGESFLLNRPSLKSAQKQR